MNFTFTQTSNKGDWSNGDGHGQPTKCGYNHDKQEVYIHVVDAYMRDAHYDALCSYDEVIKRHGNYKCFEKYMLKYANQEILDKLIQIIEDSQLVDSGTNSSEDSENDRSINNSREEEPLEHTPFESPLPKPETRHFSKRPKFTYNKDQDWTKTGDLSQGFSLKMFKEADFKKVPIFVYVLLSPIVGLLFLLGPFMMVDAFNRGNYFMVFIGLLSVVIGLLILYGIANYWTKMYQRSDNENRLINGKSLKTSLKDIFGERITDDQNFSMSDVYNSIIRGKHVNSEIIYKGDDFIISSCNLFYTSGYGAKTQSTYRSCFAIKLNKTVEKDIVLDRKIGKWFEANVGTDLSSYLNTHGFMLFAEENYVILLFRDAFYKSSYTFEVFKSLVAGMEAHSQTA